MNTTDKQSACIKSIKTDGGLVVDGNVYTQGNFIGRDNVTISFIGGLYEIMNKLYGVGIYFILEYFSAFISTLQNPLNRFPAVRLTSDKQHPVVLSSYKLQNQGLEEYINPALLTFVIINLILGTILGIFIPANKGVVNPRFVTEGSYLASGVFVVAYWIFTSSFTHLLCKLVRGQGKFVHTLTISLQLVSVLYVLSSFITVIVGNLFKELLQEQILFVSVGFYKIQIKNQMIDVYLLTHFIFASIYLPIALKDVHKFNRRQTLIIFALTLLVSRIPTMLLSRYLYLSLTDEELMIMISGPTSLILPGVD